MQVNIEKQGEGLILADTVRYEITGQPGEIVQVLEALGCMPEKTEPEVEWRDPVASSLVDLKDAINEAAFRAQAVEVTADASNISDEAFELLFPGAQKPEPQPDWQEIDPHDLRVGDVVRVKIKQFPGYEMERTITELQSDGQANATINGTGQESPICAADIYDSIQVDASRRGPELVAEEPEETFEFEEIAFGDIEHGDYIRTTYSDGDVHEGVAQQYTEFEFCEDDWRDADGRFVCNLDDSIDKIERRVQWESISKDDVKAGDIIRVTAPSGLLTSYDTIDHGTNLASRTGRAHELRRGDAWVDEEGKTVLNRAMLCYTKIERKVK
jgi:hypothetical protein